MEDTRLPASEPQLQQPESEEPASPTEIVERAIARLGKDVAALFEPPVLAALAKLQAEDLPTYLRLRYKAKKANPACSVTRLDEAVNGKEPGGGPPPSALDELVALARTECDLHHDQDRQAVAIISTPRRREVWRVKSSGFEAWLRAAYWRAFGAGATDTIMKAALATLEAAGINDGDQVEVHLRVARYQDGYVIDLCDEHWQAVHVTPDGWRIVSRSPVLFTRTASMRALPEPEAGPGDVTLLLRYTNVPPADFPMLLAWLIECFRPDTPFPVLELVGEQGSAKSTTQSVLRSLVDPNKVMLRGRPKSVEDIFVAAHNNWLVSYENLSSLTAEQQDAFCTLATGGGFAARQLYSNGEEHVMETKRPAVLNGIAVVATRPDLIDRVVHIDMPVIAPERRKDDSETRDAWERDRPRAFAGLLDLFSRVLDYLPEVQLEQKQRMADFERLGAAVSYCLGWEEVDFQRRYAEMVRAGAERALEGNPVAQALDKFLAKRIPPISWKGTAGQLYDELNQYIVHDRTTWPRSPKGLSDQLRRIAPAYRTKGIEISHLGHSREGAMWRIASVKPASAAPVSPNATPPGAEGGL
ncbi:hypothetical protein OOT46_22845 [Aquabacterium sp. A7-Y]|uniref:hypothetical protein n=1 Tax=Aquabacterium sp. A7-Y TaxID=1349605 RepID=UPI00223D6EA9|nr:hypothetical protein [Aquabacterium sp. A7-Y]MCW7540661.1 hypothetical protein [Aquabacterium sp. A7-Y]